VDNEQSEQLQYIYGALRRLHTLADKFAQALIVLESYQALDDVIRELTEELPHQLDRIEQAILIILDQAGGRQAGHRTQKITAELRAEIVAGRVASLKRQIERQQLNLNQLEEQAADYGADVPLHVTNHIIRIRRKIEELQEEMQFYKDE